MSRHFFLAKTSEIMQFGHSLTEKSGFGKWHLADFENNQIFLIRTKSKILLNPNNFLKKRKFLQII